MSNAEPGDVETYEGDDFYCDMVFSGRIAVEKVLETPAILAFHHTRPFYPVHLVVVPKAHVPSLLEADDTLLLELLAAVKQISQDVLNRYGACRLLTNLGAYQDSKHLHWHVAYGEPL